jgi:hypothetical protein
MNTSDDFDRLINGRLDEEDLRILTAMAALYAKEDPVPDGQIDRMIIGTMLAELETELAEIQSIAPELVGARGEVAEQARTITFASDSLTVMITVTAIGAEQVRLDGWVAPAAQMTVDLQLAAGSLRVESDLDGRFVFERVATGMAKLILRADEDSEGRAVATPTIQL